MEEGKDGSCQNRGFARILRMDADFRIFVYRCFLSGEQGWGEWRFSDTN